MEDRTLGNAVSGHPGLRVPGAFDGFELALRAVLGQQVSVKAATTLAAISLRRDNLSTFPPVLVDNHNNGTDNLTPENG